MKKSRTKYITATIITFISTITVLTSLSCKHKSSNSDSVKSLGQFSDTVIIPIAEHMKENADKFEGTDGKWKLISKEKIWDSAKPTLILVHGINPVDGEFNPVIHEMGKAGFQVFLYQYDWNASLEVSANYLVLAVRRLKKFLPFDHLYILAHSMGGLVSRRAMIKGRGPSLESDNITIDFTTIASPFGGYKSANLTNFVPGDFFGIPDAHKFLGTLTSFIKEPGSLMANARHLKIETIETGKKRYYRGEIVGDDKASPANQANPVVDTDPRAKLVTISAGHSGILSNDLMQLNRYLTEYIWDLTSTFKCRPDCTAKISDGFTETKQIPYN